MSKNVLIISSSMSGTRNTKKLCEQFEKRGNRVFK